MFGISYLPIWRGGEMETFDLVSHINNINDKYCVIWLFNIGVEKYWSSIYSGVVASKEDEIINCSEEMMLLLAQPQDIVIMRKQPQREYLEDLSRHGFVLPRILSPEMEDDSKCISELILDDEGLLIQIREAGLREQVVFFPYGVSNLEEQIADLCNLKLVGSSKMKARSINDKIYARQISQELGFPTSEGYVCHTLDEMQNAYNQLKKDYNRIIVKTPCNASGKGMWLVDDEKRLKVVNRIITKYIRTTEKASWLVEGWLNKLMDINCQIFVSQDGKIDVFSIKEQVTEDTVYVGSVFPPRMSQEQYDTCYRYGQIIGKYLFDHSFFGVFGVDGLITVSGKVIPIIEINGRCTLSTYTSFLNKQFGNKLFLSFYKRAFVKNSIDYDRIVYELKTRGLYSNGMASGLFLYTSATLDSLRFKNMIRVFGVSYGDTYDDVLSQKKRFDTLCAELGIDDI